MLDPALTLLEQAYLARPDLFVAGAIGFCVLIVGSLLVEAIRSVWRWLRGGRNGRPFGSMFS
jgi:hypothetical protein